ncbi:MAG: transposase [Rhodoplanes sp.]
MRRESLVNEDWTRVVARLGGVEKLAATARETRAFLRPREIANAVDLLRLILAYCLGKRGLRSTAAWAASVGLVDISNVALLYRLRRCGDWLAMLVGRALAAAAPKASQGRMIRIVDATAVPKAGPGARTKSELWRIHSAFDLPHERFGHFELTDQRAGETLDRIPVVKGEIRLADRAYLQPDRMAVLLEAGADFVVRAGWRSARWREADGTAVDLIAEFRKGGGARADRSADPDRTQARRTARLAPGRRQEAAAGGCGRRKARRDAQREGYRLSKRTLAAADWVILVTSLTPADFATADVLALYRLRWRIELGFKRLKSLIGLKGPPGADQRSARPHVLAHLLMILLLEPLVDALEDSPPSAKAA